MINENVKEEIKTVTQNLLVDWHKKYHQINPKPLWHYTGINALHSILSKRKIWFSQAIFLNDSSEMKYAVDLIEEIIKGKIQILSSDIVKEYVQSFLDSVIYKRDSIHSHGITSPAFVSCFCEDGDSLHLWRAYTDNGKGYSIGLFPDSILSRLNKFKIIESNYTANNEKKSWEWIFSARLRKVIYDRAEQSKIVEKLIDSYINLVQQNEENLMEGNTNNWDKRFIINQFSELFGEFLNRFKHPTFAEEKEWRFIYTLDKNIEGEGADNIEQKELFYRTSGSYLVPYIEIDISNPRERLSFEEIIAGPSVDYKLAQTSISSFLYRNGYLGTMAHVSPSNIPLRYL